METKEIDKVLYFDKVMKAMDVLIQTCAKHNDRISNISVRFFGDVEENKSVEDKVAMSKENGIMNKLEIKLKILEEFLMIQDKLIENFEKI